MVSYSDTEREAPPQRSGQGRGQAGRGERLARLRERNAALPHDQAVEGAREDALRLLDMQARSSAQIREKLAQRGYDARAIAEVIDRLTRVGLLDDAHYAAMVVRTRFAERGLVGQALRRELARYGIGAAEADAAMEQVQAADVSERARQLALKKVSTGGDPVKLKRRALFYLARRGYSQAVAIDAVQYALAKQEGD